MEIRHGHNETDSLYCCFPDIDGHLLSIKLEDNLIARRGFSVNYGTIAGVALLAVILTAMRNIYVITIIVIFSLCS
jgi:hypothetical protein|tara:strand:- start:2657 stop:2884 length:228 start_codon:yes stop_codon:yes gene_type:complete